MLTQTEKQKMFHTVLARGATRSGGKVTKRKRVATTLDDKDNVDPHEGKRYENCTFTGTCQ